MKSLLLIFFALVTAQVFAQTKCDLKMSHSVGVKTVEFISGNVVHSKMAMKESTADALAEELINLQDAGICDQEFIAQKCVLKFEKAKKVNFISMYRGTERWLTWNLSAKLKAQNYVTGLKRFGFCL
jgi:hypothetical protein